MNERWRLFGTKKRRRERYEVRDDVVRAWGLEPQRRKAREPKSRMSTNSIMPAAMSGRTACRYFTPCFYTAGDPRRSVLLDPRL